MPRSSPSAGSASRMNRDEFFATLAKLDEQRLQKALWNLYWRGSAALRERIEVEIDPHGHEARKPCTPEPVESHWVFGEVREFVALARSGAYIGGDRRVSPRERTRWRFTFRRLIADAQEALHSEDFGSAATAVEELIDLACATRAYDYFRSEEPLEAARFVVSEAVALLWGRFRDRCGFAEFAQRAAPELVRWESNSGWTRGGWGAISQQETSLASVLAGMLPVTAMWITFADRYLDALDQVAPDDTSKPKQPWRPTGREREERTANLAEWHRLLLDRLTGSEAEDRLDRLAGHAALGGPELTFLQAQLAHRRGDVSRAGDLAYESLQALPGHPSFFAFATEIDAPLPPGARHAANDRQIASQRLS